MHNKLVKQGFQRSNYLHLQLFWGALHTFYLSQSCTQWHKQIGGCGSLQFFAEKEECDKSSLELFCLKCWILLSFSIIVANFFLSLFSEGISFAHSYSGHVHKHTKILKQLANFNCVWQRNSSQSLKVLKAFRGKGKAAVYPDTLVLNSHGTSTWSHEHIKLNQLPKVHEITCLNTTANCNNNNKKSHLNHQSWKASF